MRKVKEHISLTAEQSTSFEKLWEENQLDVYRFVLPLTKHVQDAEDVVQDTFVRAYGGFHNFRGEAQFKTWVYRIAWNVNLDRVRGSKGKAKFISIDDTVEDDKTPLQIADPHYNPETLFFDGHFLPEVLPKLERVINSLPPIKRLALILSLQGFSMDEIAEISGCNPSTARSNLHKARKIVREKFQLAFPS